MSILSGIQGVLVLCKEIQNLALGVVLVDSPNDLWEEATHSLCFRLQGEKALLYLQQREESIVQMAEVHRPSLGAVDVPARQGAHYGLCAKLITPHIEEPVYPAWCYSQISL